MKLMLHEQIIKGVVHDLHLFEPEIYADQEAFGRSGHTGHAMTEFAPGKVLDFNSNTSGKRFEGHSNFGWVETRISTDWGRTFDSPKILPYSWDTLLDGQQTISVEKAVTAPDGSISAFCLRGSQKNEICHQPYDSPTRIRSEDGGLTWSDAEEVSPYPGRIYDAILHDSCIYFLMFCSDASISFCGVGPEDVYRLYRSDDNGKTFREICIVPFPDTNGRGYGNMSVSPCGELIVYAYNLNDEYRMDYIISPDWGKTWKNAGVSYVAKRIRNPQIGILDEQYILHGRAGEDETGAGAFVIYTSADGVHWDDGKILVEERSACFYSNNLVITDPNGKERMLVQYSENYHIREPGIWRAQTNVMHMWLESI